MAAPYILARTLRDAHEFARGELGLTRGKYRIVTSPSTLSGRRGADVYLVPGYQNRHDRFAMRGALRYSKLNLIDVEKMRAEALENDPDGLNPPGTQPSIIEGADPTLVAEFEAFLTGNAEHPHEQTEVSDAHEFVTAEHLPDDIDAPLDQSGGSFEDLDEPQAEEPAPAEDTTKRRRRRCKECGILVEPDEVEQHAAEHLPEEQ